MKKELTKEETLKEMDRELEEVNKEIEDNLDNVEDESFILSQKENAIMIPLMLGGFLIFTLYMILPLFNINLFLIHFILFVILLFFVWFAIKIYPTPEDYENSENDLGNPMRFFEGFIYVRVFSERFICQSSRCR